MIIDSIRCTICLEDFQSDDEKTLAHRPEPIGVAPHVFHAVCLNNWALVHPECPLCKRAIAPGIPSFRIMAIAQDAGLVREQLDVVRLAQENKLISLAYALYSNPINQQTRGFAVRCAAKEGNFLVLLLLLKTGTISSLDLGLSVKSAAKRGDLLLVSTLLNTGTISIEHRGKASRNAAIGGYYSIVKILLDSGPVLGNDLYLSLLASADHDDYGMFRYLLDKPLSVELRGNAMLYLLRRGNFLLAQEVFEKGPIIKSAIQEAVIISATHGHSVLLNCLLKQEEIEDHIILRALQTVCREDFIRIFLALILYRYQGDENAAFPEVSIMLQTQQINSTQLGRGVCWLAERGFSRLVELLLQKGPITHNHRGLALSLAAKFGSFFLVQLLTQNGYVEERDIYFSLIESVKISNAEIVSFLIPFVTFKSVDIDYAIWLASVKGCLNIVDSLLVLTTFEGVFLEWAIEDALTNGHFLVAVSIVCHFVKNKKNAYFLISSLRWFLIENPIDRREIKRAFFYAIDSGCKDLIRVFVRGYAISDAERQMFLLYALESNQNEIAKILY